MSRARYLLFRIVQTIFLIWLAATAVFFLMRAMPGSYADQLVFAGASPETIAALEEKWGLNDPLYIQYLQFIGNLLTFDSGVSLRFNEPVWEVIRPKMFNSFILVAPAITSAYVVGSVIGAVMGTRHGSLFERYGIVPIVYVGAFPSFITAIFLIIIFSGELNWFPSQGILSASATNELTDSAWWKAYFHPDFAMHYVLPFTAVFLRYLYLPSLIMRTSIVEVLEQDFVEYQRLVGRSKLNRLQQLSKHASLPVITIYPISMTRAISGLILIETVFNWPGLGFELFKAILNRDFPVLQFVFFLIAVFIILSNFFVDVLYGFIDPRVSIDD